MIRHLNCMLPRALLILALLAPGALPQDRSSQKPEELPPPISVEVNVVNILASVRDKRGALIPSLGKDDFEVLEDGKRQEIKYFARETNLPLTIGLLVDVSRSQERLIDIEKRAGIEFLSKVLREKDMAFLMSFGSEAELLQDYTNSRRLLQEGLERLRVVSDVGGLHPGPVPTMSQPRGTVLFDAVYLAATEKLASEVGRKAMVLITDGVDQGSRVSRDRAIEYAQKSDAVIYSIYYVDPSAYGGPMSFYHPSDSDLKRLSEETGGRIFHVDRKHTLPDVFRELQEEMRTQYAIGYTPTNEARDGAFRRVELKAKDKNLRVQARKGYYAAKPR